MTAKGVNEEVRASVKVLVRLQCPVWKIKMGMDMDMDMEMSKRELVCVRGKRQSTGLPYYCDRDCD